MVTDRFGNAEYYGEKPPAMYDQRYVDMLKVEIDHYKKLYREQLVRTKQLERKVKNANGR